LTIALICGYKFIESIFGMVLALLYQNTDPYSGVWSYIYRVLIASAVYCVALIVLVRYNRELANYVDRVGNSNAVQEETIHLSIEQANLLYIVLVAVCLITLIQEIPTLLLSIYNYFKKEIGRFGSRDDLNFKISAIKFVFAIIVLLAARPISAWFSNQPRSGKSLVQTTSET
jgi:hypothetical protein